jgi:hypothetical protein
MSTHRFLLVLTAATACAKQSPSPPLANNAPDHRVEPTSPKPLSAEECEALRHHLIELGVPAEPKRYQAYAEGSPTEECQRNVTRQAFDCSMNASTVELVTRCMSPSGG